MQTFRAMIWRLVATLVAVGAAGRPLRAQGADCTSFSDVDAEHVASLCEHIRRCQTSRGPLNAVPYQYIGAPVLLQQYFNAYGLLCLFAESRINPVQAAANRPVIQDWLVHHANLMAPTGPLSAEQELQVDTSRPLNRMGAKTSAGAAATDNYYVPRPVSGTFDPVDEWVQPGASSECVDADDSIAAMYLLIAGLYARDPGVAGEDADIRRGVEAAMAILRACRDPKCESRRPYRSFWTSRTCPDPDPFPDLRQCLDNIEVGLGLTAVQWYFERWPNDALGQEARKSSRELAFALTEFEHVTSEGERYFLPLPNETVNTTLGSHPSHGFTNLRAITHLLPSQVERDALYQLVHDAIPREFGNPPDAERVCDLMGCQVEGTFTPDWSLAANRTSLASLQSLSRTHNRGRVQFLREQSCEILNQQKNYAGYWAFREFEVSLAVLALISESHLIDELPQAPYPFTIHGDDGGDRFDVYVEPPMRVTRNGDSVDIPDGVEHILIDSGVGSDAIYIHHPGGNQTLTIGDSDWRPQASPETPSWMRLDGPYGMIGVRARGHATLTIETSPPE
ncbi:MAG: hypothetical protein KDA75_06255 [Planctomycetaceae bacterium]|nr:hypothetical protein [Planctomycetaceae bacterium]